MSTRRSIFLCIAATAIFSSCNDTRLDPKGSPSSSAADQYFTVAVESIGELFAVSKGAELQPATRRPISSITPTQTFDKLSLIIVTYGSPAKVVYKTTIDGWSDPNNQASIPWSTDEGRGRYTTLRLSGDSRLEEGQSYMAYAIGYQSGSYDNYEPFAGVAIGDTYNRTEVASIKGGDVAEEIFAGAEIFFVQDGKILSKRSEEADTEQGLIVLRRQVAGTFGYFTRIPAKVGSDEVAKLRLVTTRSNRTVIFGGFRGKDDPFDFLKDNVINGMDERSDFDASLAGSSRKDAFSVYEIALNRWFPGNTADPRLSLDYNGDGYLDNEDDNWQTDSEMYPSGSISLPQGTVFGDRFLIATAMGREDVEAGRPTFQLQLLDAEEEVIRYWNVTLRHADPDADADRTWVSLPDGTEGRTEISSLENVDTESCFSIVRNRLYTMGEKSLSQNYGEDRPTDLSGANELVLDEHHEWQLLNSIIFNL